MIEDVDRFVLARDAGVGPIELSDTLPWPALDFAHEGAQYTLHYGIATDVFVLYRRDTNEMWSYTYRSTWEGNQPKARIYVAPCLPELPLTNGPLRYMSAMIICDVRRVTGRRPKHQEATWN